MLAYKFTDFGGYFYRYGLPVDLYKPLKFFRGNSFMYGEKSKYDNELCCYAPRCLIYPITTQITATINAIANFVNEPLYSLVGWSMQ